MKYKVNLKGKIYEVEVEKGEAMIAEEYDAIVPNAPEKKAYHIETTQNQQSSVASITSGNAVKAPLPGNIMSVKVSQGQSVKAGDLLLIIEAMKMENEVLAPCDGVIKQISVNKGQTVATGDILVVL